MMKFLIDLSVPLPPRLANEHGAELAKMRNNLSFHTSAFNFILIAKTWKRRCRTAFSEFFFDCLGHDYYTVVNFISGEQSNTCSHNCIVYLKGSTVTINIRLQQIPSVSISHRQTVGRSNESASQEKKQAFPAPFISGWRGGDGHPIATFHRNWSTATVTVTLY